ncbi:putative meiotically up-regulated gene 185 protein [Neofusicoccum parvum UCRNP2]|uniref:Putative meiotically up-regulated gene 185 protein n=1 Tax=Botryosphaeria parva (strain UCR-NP2) TaxID=1287680 RepID=R1G0Y0_BOTPV|nr:putative meiotically up-regulated gene 185 protein [Neofusicoccum parvum UCRNP2]
MGSGQSSASGGGASQAAANTAVKTSYYELLGVERQATDEEIKKAYRRKALELHPDRNHGNEEWATAMFAEVQSAHEVLSDPQERAWYDSHESAILSGADPADAHFEHDVKVTTADDLTRMLRRFNSRVEYSDEPDGFFGFLRDTFHTLAKEEMVAASWEGLEPVEYPSFGGKDDPYDEVVRRFYAVWVSFSTKKSFAWKDIYRYSDAPDRRTRRYMEKENSRLREEGIREFNDAVRNLVAFVRKRDPRWAPNTQTEAERQKALKEMRDAQAARARAEREALMQEEVPEWTKTRDPEELEESEEEEIVEEHFECVACNKTFKSENQWQAHEKSKKHQKAVYALQKKMRKENKSLNLDDDVPSSGMATPDVDEDEELLEEDQDELDVRETTEAMEDATLEEDKHSEDEAPIKEKEATANGDKPTPSESEDDASDEDYVPRSKLESRLAGADPSHKDDEDSKPNSAFVSDDDKPAGPAAPKMGKAAQKRAKKAAKQAVADQEELKFKCARCQAGFPSKTKLFDHIKDEGHAAPVCQTKGAGGGGKKKKGKK